MTKEKTARLTAEERLNVVIACRPLADDVIYQLYREKAYTHITSNNGKMIPSMLATLQKLRVILSFSSPSISNGIILILSQCYSEHLNIDQNIQKWRLTV